VRRTKERRGKKKEKKREKPTISPVQRLCKDQKKTDDKSPNGAYIILFVERRVLTDFSLADRD